MRNFALLFILVLFSGVFYVELTTLQRLDWIIIDSFLIGWSSSLLLTNLLK